jgi:hypothetical protein
VPITGFELAWIRDDLSASVPCSLRRPLRAWWNGAVVSLSHIGTTLSDDYQDPA